MSSLDNPDKFNRFIQSNPHAHAGFSRPHFSRRRFFELAGTGVGLSCLVNEKALACTVQQKQNVATQNKAKNCIFILLAGAPSHTDTFDLKMVNGVTPAAFSPAVVQGVNWPMGIMPKLGGQMGNMSIVRSVQSWALVHSLAQRWTQIGRNPTAALGDIAPNIGSIVSIEKASERTPGQVLPTFLALNSVTAPGNGYLSAEYAPFKVTPATTGIPNTTNTLGQARFNTLWSRVHELDDPLRANSPLGTPVSDYDQFYSAANQIMYNPTVQSAFGFTAADSARYGATGFGDACLVARQVLAANQGTRFIQITLGGWDMHTDIYGAANPRGTNLLTLAPTLDNGVGTLISDLSAAGLLKDTLIVLAGEFGRTVGALSGAGGRDHLLQQSVVFAGAGVHGGKVIGATNASGSDTADFGWSRKRYVKPEDIEATIYSALGINWTTVRCDDPFNRGFEYVPFSDQDLYGPINELWT